MDTNRKWDKSNRKHQHFIIRTVEPWSWRRPRTSKISTPSLIFWNRTVRFGGILWCISRRISSRRYSYTEAGSSTYRLWFVLRLHSQLERLDWSCRRASRPLLSCIGASGSPWKPSPPKTSSSGRNMAPAEGSLVSLSPSFCHFFFLLSYLACRWGARFAEEASSQGSLFACFPVRSRFYKGHGVWKLVKVTSFPSAFMHCFWTGHSSEPFWGFSAFLSCPLCRPCWPTKGSWCRESCPRPGGMTLPDLREDRAIDWPCTSLCLYESSLTNESTDLNLKRNQRNAVTCHFSTIP